MFDCANVEMRELLPEVAAGTLDASTRARVDAHVATCPECASELETLRLVRRAFAGTPAVDTRRIVAALPKPPVVARSHRPRVAPRRWLDWRIAAALTMVTVGGLSVLVSQRGQRVGEDGRSPSPTRAETTAVVQPPLLATADTPAPVPLRGTPRVAPATVRTEKATLSFGGDVDELDRPSLEALIGVLEEIDSSPVAPSAEPGRLTALPIITDDTR